MIRVTNKVSLSITIALIISVASYRVYYKSYEKAEFESLDQCYMNKLIKGCPENCVFVAEFDSSYTLKEQVSYYALVQTLKREGEYSAFRDSLSKADVKSFNVDDLLVDSTKIIEKATIKYFVDSTISGSLFYQNNKSKLKSFKENLSKRRRHSYLYSYRYKIENDSCDILVVDAGGFLDQCEGPIKSETYFVYGDSIWKLKNSFFNNDIDLKTYTD